MLIPLLAMVRKDLQLFLTDRRLVIMSFVAPILIAAFFGTVFSGVNSGGAARVPVAIVDLDGTAVARAIVAAAQADATLDVTTPDADAARARVREGELSVAVVIPKGFGDAAGLAFFGGGTKPELTMLYDPSEASEMALVRGVMTEHVMQAVSADVFGGAGGQRIIDDTLAGLKTSGLPSEQQALLGQLMTAARGFYQSGATPPAAGSAPAPRGLSMPYVTKTEAVTSGENVAYNGYAHSFAGMSIQFLLFASIDLGIGILLERQRGLWKRLRSAPLSRFMLLGGKAVSGTIIALITLLVSFSAAILIFGVRISGSVPGFLAVAVSCAMMAASFGILVASLGRTPGGSRGLASLSVLMMVMLGGAWVPTFIFPEWLQKVTVVVPARWAVDGLDAMTWRGLGFEAAVLPTVVMVGFTILFGTIALARFRWEEN